MPQTPQTMGTVKLKHVREILVDQTGFNIPKFIKLTFDMNVKLTILQYLL